MTAHQTGSVPPKYPRYEKIGGIIETGISGCCCPPGERKSGQHTNASTKWFRVNSGPWRKWPGGSSTLLHKCLKHSATTDEFETLIARAEAGEAIP